LVCCKSVIYLFLVYLTYTDLENVIFYAPTMIIFTQFEVDITAHVTAL